MVDMAPTPPIPKYYKVRESIRKQILEWEEGKMIPSESELCDTYAVSRITIRRAVTDLVQDGLLRSIQGKGTFVTKPSFQRAHRERMVREIKGFFGDMSSRGYKVGSRVLEKSIIEYPLEAVEPLKLAPNDKTLKVVRLRFVNNQPDHVVYSYLPLGLFPNIDRHDFSKGSLYAILREEYGANLNRARYLAEATIATEREVELLEIEPGSPMLLIYSSIFNEEDRPIVFGYSRHRSDKGQVEFEVVVSNKSEISR